MAGLVLLAALIALIAFLIWLSGLLTRWLPLSYNWKAMLRVSIVVGSFPLMVADEIIGMHQFEALCKENGIESADLSKATAKRVRGKSSERFFLHDSILPTKVSNELILDASTNEVLAEYKDYFSSGGWLVRNTPIRMGSSEPMLFHGNGCGFQLKDRIFLDYRIVQIN